MLEKRPIVYDGDIVLGGNQRLQVLKELAKDGFEIKDSYFADASSWSEKQKKQFVITDNISEGDWDFDVLANEWDDLPLEEWGMDTTGWKKEVEEDEAPEVAKGEPDSKIGEAYQLGRHRLMCGDATKLKDVEKLMGGKKADMVFTDPPYKLQTKGFGPEEKYQYGGMDSREPPKYSEWLGNVDKVSSDNFNIMVWEFWRNIPELWQEMEKFWKIQNLCIWHATNRYRTWGGKYFMNAYDIFLYANKGDYMFNNAYMKTGNQLNDIIDNAVSNPHESGQKEVFGAKPIKLLVPYLIVLTKKENLVLDLFGGSGSTLIAAEQTNRVCYMMEIDPRYCDVIRKRYDIFVKGV